MATPQQDPKTEAAKAQIASIVREQMDVVIKDMQDRAKVGQYDNLEMPYGLPKLKMQWSADLYDPLKGKGWRAAQFIKCLMIAAGATGVRSTPKEVAEAFEAKGLVDPLVTKALSDPNITTKALAEQTSQDGGVLVPPEFAAEFIQLLRPLTVVRESGIRVVPMSGQQLVYARQNSAGTASYEGENMAVLASQQTFGQLRLLARKLMALTSVSNDLLRDAGPAADMVVRDDLAAIVALRMDLAALRGDGTSETPRGLDAQIDSANVFAATQVGSAATFQEMANDIEKLLRLIKEANVPFKQDDLGWVMAPRSEAYLKSVSSTYGVFPFREEVRKGELAGAKVKTTTQIPTNLGGGANESAIYVGAWPHYIMGENTSLNIEVFPGGTYTDASGNLVSGISADQTPIRALMRHDFQLRYTKAFAKLSTVKWGV